MSRYRNSIKQWKPFEMNEDIEKQVSDLEDEAILLELITENPSISRAELSKRLDLSERQVRKIIDQLRNAGKLKREGGKTGKWIITEE